MFSTTAMSLVILSPPTGIEFVYINEFPSNTPISVFPAPMSNNIILSCISFLSNIRFLSANVIGTIPSISSPAFLNIDVSCLTKSFSANITCASIVKLALKFPTGSATTVPFSNVILSGTMSINVFPSGISISFTWIIAFCTSLTDIPEYLSFTSFVMLFCTIVTCFPGIVTYAEFIFKFVSSSASFIVLARLSVISSSFIIFPFFSPLHLYDVLLIISIWPKLLTSPTTVATFVVPMSTPTIISPIAKLIPPFFCFNFHNVFILHF